MMRCFVSCAASVQQVCPADLAEGGAALFVLSDCPLQDAGEREMVLEIIKCLKHFVCKFAHFVHGVRL